MKDHIESLHQGRINTCDICNKQYATKNSLQNHMSTYHNKMKLNQYHM